MISTNRHYSGEGFNLHFPLVRFIPDKWVSSLSGNLILIHGRWIMLENCFQVARDVDVTKIGGIVVPLVTPFDNHGDLDVEKARCLIEWHIEQGVDGFYVGGSTGEGFFQSVDERCQYLEFVADVLKRRGMLIAQVGAFSVRDLHQLARFAAAKGYDVVSSTPPMFFKHTDVELIEYYRELAQVSEVPVLLYNVPGMAGLTMAAATMVDMLRLPNVVGSKHTDMNFYVAERLLREVPGAAIFNGPDEMLTSGLAMGMVGGIGSTYNLMPSLYVEIYEAVKMGNLDRARHLQATVNDITQELLRISPGVVPGIKHGLNVLGFDVGEPRRPFQPLATDTAQFERLLGASR